MLTGGTGFFNFVEWLCREVLRDVECLSKKS